MVITPQKQSKSDRNAQVLAVRKNLGSASGQPPGISEVRRAAEALNKLMQLSTDGSFQLVLCRTATDISGGRVQPVTEEEMRALITDWEETEAHRRASRPPAASAGNGTNKRRGRGKSASH